jgi:uncharacterized RDD family membrane protein YckC
MLDTSRPPSFFRRLAIVTYDALLLLALLFFATALLLPFNHGSSFQPNSVLFTLYLIGVSFLFYGWFWTHGGQTLGLKTWKCKVIQTDGSSLSWKHAFYRFITAIVSWGCVGLGFVWILFNQQRRAWHDISSKSQLSWEHPEKH